MRISGAAVGGGQSTGSRKASIERQIRKLEKKRDEILEKLGAKKSSKKRDNPGISTGNLRINSGGSGDQGEASTPQIGGSESGVAAPSTDIFSGASLDIGKALREISQGLSSAADVPDLAEDPKELMKQLQLIEMQIMALRQQLDGDESPEAIELDPEEAAGYAASGLAAQQADKTVESPAPLPAVEITAEGHVDGYA